MITILHGDCRDVLRTLPDASVQCCVTSPPYWGLRNYGVDATVWGGDSECDHGWGDLIAVNATNHTDKRRWNHTRNGRDEEQPTEKRVAWLRTKVPQGKFCQHCGAWAGALGLEPTPDLFIEHIVEVFREVRRVLRDDGVLLMNLGDSYATGAGKVGDRPGGGAQGDRWAGGRGAVLGPMTQPNRMPLPGLKAKDLIGIPWMAAFALRADGWWLRRDIIWSKPNPMPESVTDRPTTAHEYVFLFAKSGDHTFWSHRDGPGVREHPEPDYRWIHRETKEEVRVAPHGLSEDIKKIWRRVNLWAGHDYFWDAEAVRESAVGLNDHDLTGQGYDAPGQTLQRGNRAKGNAKTFRGGGAYTRGQSFDNGGEVERESHGNVPNDSGTRNCRSVWTIATSPLPEAHFATFPPDLAERCILAGTSAHGCCSACGAPWVRQTERTAMVIDRSERTHEKGRTRSSGTMVEPPTCKTVGWLPSCECGADVVPCTILDPFGGAGTTGLVADRLGRNAILVELNGDYIDIAKRRLTKDAGMFAQVTTP